MHFGAVSFISGSFIGDQQIAPFQACQLAAELGFEQPNYPQQQRHCKRTGQDHLYEPQQYLQSLPISVANVKDLLPSE